MPRGTQLRLTNPYKPEIRWRTGPAGDLQRSGASVLSCGVCPYSGKEQVAIASFWAEKLHSQGVWKLTDALAWEEGEPRKASVRNLSLSCGWEATGGGIRAVAPGVARRGGMLEPRRDISQVSRVLQRAGRSGSDASTWGLASLESLPGLLSVPVKRDSPRRTWNQLLPQPHCAMGVYVIDTIYLLLCLPRSSVRSSRMGSCLRPWCIVGAVFRHVEFVSLAGHPGR